MKNFNFLLKKDIKIINIISSPSFSINKQIVKSFSRKDRIEKKLTEKYLPLKLEVLNDSNNHSVKENSETHFRVYIVSEEFKNKSKVQIHRDIYKLFENEMGEKHLNKLHSLSIFTNTPEEYKKIDNDESVLGNKVPPLCASKNKNDKI